MLQADIDVRGDRVCRLHFQLLSMGLQVVRLERHVLGLSLRRSLQPHTQSQSRLARPMLLQPS